MKLVVDATILFTGLIGVGITKDIIFSEAVDLYAPEYLFEEFEKHKSRIKTLSKMSSGEVEMVLNKLSSKIKSVPKRKFEKFLNQANSLIKDKNDTPYLALALAEKDMAIWSNDFHFKKQSKVKVFTTKQLVRRMKSSRYKFSY
ncbi:MAG: hypothetical protein KJ879_02180 [Nanoarchaeota archaeon]|nr:hypothetical protein [Nanoarchaeota archaeon]